MIGTSDTAQDAVRARLSDERSVHEWFMAQVNRTPEAIALITVDESLSYRALNERVDRLAARLLARGIGPGQFVGLCMDLSPNLVVAMMAVLKTGGAYVPIDPSHPDIRIRFMLRDMSARVLLINAARAGRFEDLGPLALFVDVPEVDELSSPLLTDFCVAPARPDSVIYCIYTSGSTGQPKGALNFHRGFSNLVRWYVDDVGMTAQDRVMIASSISFDLTQKNIFAPLCVGACVLLPPCLPSDAAGFLRALAMMVPTWINCAPSAFRAFAASRRTGSLKTVVLGGEAIDSALTASLAGRPMRLVNCYGPTECTDVALWHVWQMDATFPKGDMPAGLAIPGVTVHVLDAALYPVADDTLGEICISGVGVGGGYLGQPALTAARFVPNPHHPAPNLLYRTGDLGRRRADGTVEFSGRQDNQVKVRGHRVELGEIESKLLSCPSLSMAAVCAYQASPGDTRLVGYVVSANGKAVSLPSLCQALRNELPEYMVPVEWVQLIAFPLNLNGKIDRKALPKPTWANNKPELFIAP